MNPRLPAVLILAALSAASRTGAKEQTSRPPASSDSGLRPLDREYALKREALLKEFSAKRRALVESPDWKNLSAEKRRAKLDKLAAEAKSRDAKLTAEYDEESRRQRGRADADAASDRQALQRRADELQRQAAQDARRVVKPP